MSEEIEMTPITPEEGGIPPPKVTPAAAAVGASTAPTVKLKPVIRKPMIRKPVIGGAKPVTLKPAVGTPPPPAAVPEAAAAPEAAAEPKPATVQPQLKSITSPIAAQAILRKTGIVAEGILTPAQAQAAKTKTSRISLESAIGVAPAMKSAAPMKTIKLRRPTDIPPSPNAIKPAVTPAAPEAPAATAPAAAPETAATATAVSTEAATVVEEKPATTAAATTTTQKKTLKLQRPGFKRPTVSGLRRPGTGDSASGSTVATQPTATAAGGDVADLSTVADIPDIKPLPQANMAPVRDESGTVAGAPTWLNVTTLIAGIAALVVIGLCTWTLFREAVGPAAGPNDLASFQSDTDYRR